MNILLMLFSLIRPSTPIFDLLEHKYQDKWLAQRRNTELSKRQEETKVHTLKRNLLICIQCLWFTENASAWQTKHGAMCN